MTNRIMELADALCRDYMTFAEVGTRAALAAEVERVEAEMAELRLEVISLIGQEHPTGPVVKESPDFCDTHCTWMDHHPDCPKSNDIEGAPV